MEKKIVCTQCGLSFLADYAHKGTINCPGCLSPVTIPGESANTEINSYRILEMVGQGGMGQVFKAVSPNGKIVALKVMSPELMSSSELVERFKREMKILSSLNHPHIVSVFDQGETEETQYFVMEFIEGTTLRDLLRKGPISEQMIVKISIETLAALGYAHSRGIIHRDVKPENIILNKENHVKVTDFGLARKESWGSGQHNSLTAANAYLGTESYMSPEQKVNPKSVTHKSDIYSLGVVIYEMLTDGNLPMGVFQPPSYYKPLDDFWDKLIFRMLDVNPEMRPNNCYQIIQEIEEYWKRKNQSTLETSHKNSKESVPLKLKQLATQKLQENSEEINYEQTLNEIRKIIQQAKDLCDMGKFAEALPIWTNALNLLDDPIDRQNALQWIEICKEKIREAELGPKVTFLCPHCRKIFQRYATEEPPERFSCPNCHGELKYDRIRKRVAAFKVDSATFTDQQTSQKSVDATNSNFISFVDPYIIILLIAIWLDWLKPEIANGFFGYVCSLFMEWHEIGEIPFPVIYFRTILGLALGFRIFQTIIKIIHINRKV